MEELRSYWEVAGIAHFLFLFKDGFKLPKISYEELEAALLTPVPHIQQQTDPVATTSRKSTKDKNYEDDDDDNESKSEKDSEANFNVRPNRTDNNKDSEDDENDNDDEEDSRGFRSRTRKKLSKYEADEEDFKPDIDYKIAPPPPPEPHLLVTIIVKLLKGYFNNHKITEYNWEHYLKRIFNLIWVGKEGKRSPFVLDTFDDRGRRQTKELSFNDLSLKTKAQVVYHLCELRLYNEDSSQAVNDIEEDELRVEPLGSDGKGNIYWYFFGSRLYRENPEATKRVANKIEAVKRYREFFAQEEQEKERKKRLEEEQERKKSQKSKRKCLDDHEDDQEEHNDRRKLRKHKGRHESDDEDKEEDNNNNRRSSSRRVVKPIERLNGDVLRESSKKPSSPTKKNKTKKDDTEEHYSSSFTPDPNTSCGVPLEELKEAWSCVCSTVEEWEELTETIKKGKTQADLEFHKILSENFLPRMRDVIKEEEKARKQRQYQEYKDFLASDTLSRRASSRIEKKQKEKEEEERKQKEEEERERRRRAEEEYKKREEEKIRKKEERERERLELIRKREEDRERMLLKREMQKFNLEYNRRVRREQRMERKNGSLLEGLPGEGNSQDDEDTDDDFDVNEPGVSVVTSNGWPFAEHSYCTKKWPEPVIILKKGANRLHPDLVSLPPSGKRVNHASKSTSKKKLQSNNHCGVKKIPPAQEVAKKEPKPIVVVKKSPEDEFYDSMSKVISSVISNRDSWVFHEPVDEAQVPGYYEKIMNPICLFQMRDKVARREYKSLSELEADFKLLVNNSETFNGPKSGFTAMAYGIWKHFRKSVQSKMNTSLEEPDEEKVFLFPPSKKWKKTTCDESATPNGIHVEDQGVSNVKTTETQLNSKETECKE